MFKESDHTRYDLVSAVTRGSLEVYYYTVLNLLHIFFPGPCKRVEDKFNKGHYFCVTYYI
uniref:Uncharacterized protein n=1 Tax=Aegilops tauschii subsp. strangulata TaxID=200361 RepID=A0A453NZS2_AEGTS